MVQPVAIVLSDRVVIAAQLEQKLEELDYRVSISDNPGALETLVLEHKPLVLLMDLAKDANLDAAALLAAKPDTRHVPLVGYAREISADLQARADTAGISIVVTDSAILQHLKPLLNQALHVE